MNGGNVTWTQARRVARHMLTSRVTVPSNWDSAVAMFVIIRKRKAKKKRDRKKFQKLLVGEGGGRDDTADPDESSC